ncbi:hypothetical protein FB192DRAFT_1376360 [Mucor lusitanicus]|uniref:Uncharacterized protein n=1 Tax=Mucor circinelloides f. lusitanicus TaxID=29924 RepID=A0A8H4BIG8_MUCCL|nr:hypothetical protein FB192DRAFT_1376360 [Mucor lusitanicus]
MALEWEQFDSILQHEQLDSILNNQPFIVSFLDQLYTNLKELDTSNQCYEIYPQAGPLLTRASIHPFIGHDPSITKLVLSCLLEYAKLDLDPLLDNETIPKSHLWCIIRLRRLLHVATTDTSLDFVAQISARLDKQTSSSTAALNSRLLEACLGLVHEERAFPVIERCVHLALPRQSSVDPAHFDPPPQTLLPDPLLRHLAMDSALHTHAIVCWSNDLKSRLFLHYDELLDTELLDLISECIELDQYQSLQQHISQHHLLQLAITCPDLSRMLMTKLASYVVLLLDWKVVRIMQSAYRFLEAGLSCRLFAEFMPHQFDSISKFVFSGPLESTESRRNIAWCASLASIRDVWPLVRTLVEWNQTSGLWTCVVGMVLLIGNGYTNVTFLAG